jgi:O-antigen/teichoic acid export membrane protein
MTATLLSQAVANLAPVVVTYRTPEDLVAASAFAVSFVLARVPLMFFAPVQAVLLPHLTRAAEIGRMDTVRLRMRQVLLAVTAIGVPSIVAGVLLGPWAARTLFGVTAPPSGAVFGLLGLAAVLIMAALVLQPALIALRCQRTVMVAWIAGTVVFLAILFAPIDPVVAALLAQLLGPCVVLAVAGSRLAALVRVDRPRPAV